MYVHSYKYIPWIYPYEFVRITHICVTDSSARYGGSQVPDKLIGREQNETTRRWRWLWRWSHETVFENLSQAACFVVLGSITQQYKFSSFQVPTENETRTP